MARIWIKETPKHLNEEIQVYGWVDSRRDHGQIIFIDLRDKTGKIQVVFSPEKKEIYKLAEKLRAEWVIEIKGKVNSRPENMQNPKIATGKIEIEAEELKVVSEADALPFEISDAKTVNEETRLKYRYLDLRSQRLRDNLINRHLIIKFIRDFLSTKDFIEIETPILTKSTPEGARDYVVPSRLEPGKFYALPQSPQQYKQLLMVSGIERYFQIARCFRDEDTRGDRQPEFTQLDLEMDFPTQEDILQLIEQLFKELVTKIYPNKKIKEFPFPRITYQEAMDKYQSDRPDLRETNSKGEKDPDELAFAFVVNFPLFEWKKEDKRWGAVHHPFTKPKIEPGETIEQAVQRIKKDPQLPLADQYDCVLNGNEIGGGSIRISEPELLEAIFQILGHQPEEISMKFGHLLKAFRYGTPPHGGIALGLDRIVMLLQDEPSIREVIAFPKTGDGRDLMMEAPSIIDEKQLKELHLKTLNP
ncbi:MAG: aspartate--tRNA ligase [Candidatus Pacebacteria bacterium]|nr:aspartate--tRNA ligase [Candidatus Paceibacterota bacterium]MDD5722011.1 aspartate--tRNA ligase [Candidatus Paceibacterota bacterium]